MNNPRVKEGIKREIMKNFNLTKMKTQHIRLRCTLLKQYAEGN